MRTWPIAGLTAWIVTLLAVRGQDAAAAPATVIDGPTRNGPSSQTAKAQTEEPGALGAEIGGGIGGYWAGLGLGLLAGGLVGLGVGAAASANCQSWFCNSLGPIFGAGVGGSYVGGIGATVGASLLVTHAGARHGGTGKLEWSLLGASLGAVPGGIGLTMFWAGLFGNSSGLMGAGLAIGIPFALVGPIVGAVVGYRLSSSSAEVTHVSAVRFSVIPAFAADAHGVSAGVRGTF
jgi:hypothetical protein